MQPGLTNVLDQLLGSPEVKASGPVGIGQSADGSVPLFANILGLLTQAESAPGLDGSRSPLDLMFNRPMTESAGDDGLDAVMSAEAANPISQLAPPLVTNGNIVPVVTLEPAPERTGPSVPQSDVEALPTAELPDFDVNRLNPSLKSLLESAPVDLRSAAYKVLDSRVSDGRLHMTVVADDSGERIDISVPTEILEDVPTPKNLTGVRTEKPTQGTTAPIPRIPVLPQAETLSTPREDIYAKVNVRALEVAGRNSRRPHRSE
jgi:hypothetical protein